MISFLVTINKTHSYVTEHLHSFDAHAEAVDRFGVCSISVKVV